MSKISERVGTRHDPISDYYKANVFGARPGELTLLSLLPPVDRCLILERILEGGKCDLLACIDKLSMAYYKAGWPNVAFEFLRGCATRGWLEGHYRLFAEKLNGLPVTNVSRTYDDTLQKLGEYDASSVFCRLLQTLCTRYRGNDILMRDDTPEDRNEFARERWNFVADATRSRDDDFLVPDTTSDLAPAYLLANSHCVAFSYLLGGARPLNFMFATNETVHTMSDGVREVWRKTDSEARMYSPYPYSARRDAGERAYLVAIEFPCTSDGGYQYRTSGQRITVRDVVDLMFEVMDIKPRTTNLQRLSGEKAVRFSWVFLQNDVDRLLGLFPSVRRRPMEWLQLEAVFHDMDRILNQLARKAVDVYPFLRCEFVGW